jgi:hypothetical protein
MIKNNPVETGASLLGYVVKRHVLLLVHSDHSAEPCGEDSHGER